MLELVAGAAVGLAALALVLEPLFRRVPPPPVADDDEPVPLEEMDEPKIRALMALREIEFDHATGKISEKDYADLKAKYSAAALAAMDAEAAATSAAAAASAASAARPVPSEGTDAAEALIRRAKTAPRGCPRHGTRPESDAVFCSECGSVLEPV